MPAKTYRLKIVQDGREFEAEGDKAFVLEMLKDHGPQVPPSAAPPEKGGKAGKGKPMPPSTPAGTKSLSIREFVQQMDLKKHTDITLAFGYYLEQHQSHPDFTAADINKCYYEAKMESSNTSQMIILNMKRGRLMHSKKEGKGKNRYTLTRSGENFIQSKLQRRP